MVDRSGNVVGYIDVSGSIVAAAEFGQVGQRLDQFAKSGYSFDNVSMWYASKYRDSETEFVYYGMRYYQPKHGRFINRDPIEEAGGNNLYAFCANRGANAWDVLGMSMESNGDGANPVITLDKVEVVATRERGGKVPEGPVQPRERKERNGGGSGPTGEPNSPDPDNKGECDRLKNVILNTTAMAAQAQGSLIALDDQRQALLSSAALGGVPHLDPDGFVGLAKDAYGQANQGKPNPFSSLSRVLPWADYAMIGRQDGFGSAPALASGGNAAAKTAWATGGTVAFKTMTGGSSGVVLPVLLIAKSIDMVGESLVTSLHYQYEVRKIEQAYAANAAHFKDVSKTNMRIANAAIKERERLGCK